MILVCARKYSDFEEYLQYKCSTGCNRKDYKYLSSAKDVRGYSGPETSIVLLHGWWDKLDSDEFNSVSDYAIAHKIPIVKDNGSH